MTALGWGLCPMACSPAILPGYVIPFTPGERFPDGVAVRLGWHPNDVTPGYPCIGSRQPVPPVPVQYAPTAAEGLAVQRRALDPLWSPP